MVAWLVVARHKTRHDQRIAAISSSSSRPICHASAAASHDCVRRSMPEPACCLLCPVANSTVERDLHLVIRHKHNEARLPIL